MGEVYQFYWGDCRLLVAAKLGKAHLLLNWIPAQLGSPWDSQNSPNSNLTCAGVESALGQPQYLATLLIFP